MNNKQYQQAVRYGIKMAGEYHAKDLVHDAYLRWYAKTQSDLFDQSNGTILRVIKNTRSSQYSREGFMWRGKTYPKTYRRLNDPLETYEVIGPGDPESILLSKEVFGVLKNQLNEFDQQTLNNMIQGYLLKEIGELQERSGPVITSSVKRIKEKLKELELI